MSWPLWGPFGTYIFKYLLNSPEVLTLQQHLRSSQINSSQACFILTYVFIIVPSTCQGWPLIFSAQTSLLFAVIFCSFWRKNQKDFKKCHQSDSDGKNGPDSASHAPLSEWLCSSCPCHTLCSESPLCLLALWCQCDIEKPQIWRWRKTMNKGDERRTEKKDERRVIWPSPVTQ